MLSQIVLRCLRILMVPVFVVFMLVGHVRSGPDQIYCRCDFYPGKYHRYAWTGYLARKNNQITVFGKFMDPLADKLLVCSAMICLVELRLLPSWIVIIIVGREFIISGFRLIAAERGIVIAASYWGKF